DPIHHPNSNPDGRHKLAQLVRACTGLYEATIGFGAPLISGKDSMKNDYHGPDGTISVPPTLLVSAIAKHPDIRKAVTMDVKAAGDQVYVLGVTLPELGGSQYAQQRRWSGAGVPTVDVPANRSRYLALHQAMMAELVVSCHDCSEGGLAVALAEMAFAGGLGLAIDLDAVPTDGCMRVDELLFGESAGRHVVTVMAKDQSAFETIMQGHCCRAIGTVTDAARLHLKSTDPRAVIDLALSDLKQVWQEGLTC
ncbi:MAG: phosphoribosylformylglycinamidine synthase, partial [Candidatus Sericytochromatia bacterium]|nr:phosphoribosylformylglycinamidine synthase [Candidatus Sericytochromatia bacterium]